MSPDVCTIKQGLKRQKGAGLPIALFIITVLSLLVLTMADLQDSSSQSVSLQIQSQRAFFAAESGAQIAMSVILPGTENAAGVWQKAKDNNLEDRDIGFDGADGLRGCTVNIQSEPVPDDESPAWVKVVSTGSCGGTGPDSASRIVEVKVR